MSVIRLSHPTGEINGSITLDGSKSITNRVLVIRALCSHGFNISNISSSDDSKVLANLLENAPADGVYNVGHAGTSFRFLTAYLATQPDTQILTGSDRMLQRPIGPLVDALRSLGCNITYLGEEGYPPLQIDSCDLSNLKSEVNINAGISSQYITALILIAPRLPQGLSINLEGSMVSESYLKLTLGIIEDFGIKTVYEGGSIKVDPQEYTPRDYTIEADWSASSYHYGLVALAKKATLHLSGLFEQSFQGDSAMPDIGQQIGVSSHFEESKWKLVKDEKHIGEFSYNFINQPDVAQTIGVICAANAIKNNFSGLITLRIKETDRIYAMDRELSKISSGFVLKETDSDGQEYYNILPGINFDKDIPRFDTYKDHRMAMAFAPLALLHPIEIDRPEVVSKSYPNFWTDLTSLGFEIELIEP